MPDRLDAIFYIEEPPEFSYEHGMFRVVTKVGGYRFERVMRPSVFMVALRRAADTARQHNFAGTKVVEFARKSEEEAVGH